MSDTSGEKLSLTDFSCFSSGLRLKMQSVCHESHSALWMGVEH